MVEGLNPQEAIARLEKFQQMFEVRGDEIGGCTSTLCTSAAKPCPRG